MSARGAWSAAGRARGQPEHEVLRQAAEWFAVLGAGDAAEQDRARWQRWMDARIEHRSAWQRVQAISGGLAATPAEQRAAAAAALDAAHRAGHRTGVGETAELTLPDGSRVQLDTASAADIDFGPALRRIVLRRGRLRVETAPDAAVPVRALVVDTAEGRMHALGTRFTVRQFDGATALAVAAGRVDVRPHDAAAGHRIVEAGEQLRFTRQAIAAPQPADAAGEAWVRGVLLADGLPLPAFIDELARYRRGVLRCDPALASLRVAGGYPLRDTDRALAMLAAALPVRVRQPLPAWTVVEPR